MTVTTTTASQTFQGNGVATAFPCAFEILENTDIDVYFVNPATGTQTQAVLNTDYTVAGAGASAGFTVNTTVPVPTGTNLYVVRALPLTQPTDFTNQGAFFPNMHEAALDRLCMLIQQIANYSEGLNITMPPGLVPQPLTLFPIPQAGSLIGWNAAGTALVNTGPTTGVGGISDLNVAANAAVQGTKLAFLQAGTGAVARTVQDKQRERISVLDFIPPTLYAAIKAGTNATDLAPYVQAAINSLQMNADNRGGTLYLPAGTYKLNSSMTFTAYAAGLLHNMYVVGDGPENTLLDFSGLPASTDGITFNAGAHFGVADLSVNSATRHGIAIGEGLAVGGTSYCLQYVIENVRVQGCGGDGIYSTQSYGGSYRDVWSKSNTGNGLTFAGYHTSLSVDRVQASSNGASGFSINGVVYSAFKGCASDNNEWGYALSNARGVTFSGCGSESNSREGFHVSTSDASAAGLPAAAQNVLGVVLDGCFAYNNSAAGPDAYATFLGATTANSRNIEITVNGGSAYPATSSDVAFGLVGTAGSIAIHKLAFDDSGFTAADSLSGAATIQNHGVAGRSCQLQFGTTQSVPTATDTVLTNWNTTPVVNDLGATVTGQKITIPRGVNKVRVSASIATASTSGGAERKITIEKNGAAFPGMPSHEGSPIANSATVSGVLSVVAGDTFEVHFYQDSGSAASVATGNANWFTVEAVS